jgi:hypothetical protein
MSTIDKRRFNLKLKLYIEKKRFHSNQIKAVNLIKTARELVQILGSASKKN